MAVLTEEQTMLQDQARSWTREEAPVEKFREMRDSGTEKGFAEATWAEMPAQPMAVPIWTMRRLA